MLQHDTQVQGSKQEVKVHREHYVIAIGTQTCNHSFPSKEK